MPKKRIIESIIIIIILGFVCKYIYDNYRVEPTTSLIIKEEVDCKDNIKEYYTTDKITFYLDCIDDVVVDFTDRTLELNKAYEARQIDIDAIKKLLKKKYTLNDKKVNYYENENIGMIECIFDNKTNYIFGKDIEYSEGICNERPYLTKFTKEYLVLDVSKSKTKDLTITKGNVAGIVSQHCEEFKVIGGNYESNGRAAVIVTGSGSSSNKLCYYNSVGLRPVVTIKA